ncbi:MAG: hypothetical protein HY787_25945 [Deltaproteobacteria bacterium]|nr:hypothetical protein [Deltaproteobacteria bacterium]
MKVLDWDKFALCLYDKKTLSGHRVWMDLERLSDFPDIYNWYMRLVEKKDLPLSVLNQDILSAGRKMLNTAPVQITRYYGKNKKGEIRICPEGVLNFPLGQFILGRCCLPFYKMRQTAADLTGRIMTAGV